MLCLSLWDVRARHSETNVLAGRTNGHLLCPFDVQLSITQMGPPRASAARMCWLCDGTRRTAASLLAAHSTIRLSMAPQPSPQTRVPPPAAAGTSDRTRVRCACCYRGLAPLAALVLLLTGWEAHNTYPTPILDTLAAQRLIYTGSNCCSRTPPHRHALLLPLQQQQQWWWWCTSRHPAPSTSLLLRQLTGSWWARAHARSASPRAA
jgi:hypothetical protein